MDEQIEKQKIKLNEIATEVGLNSESDPLESAESNSSRTAIDAPKDLADRQLLGQAARQPEERSKAQSNVQSKSSSVSESSQAVSSANPTVDAKPRNWLSGILLFLTVNSYVAIMTLFTQLMAKGGFEAWLELVKFNGFEILGFLAFGPKQFAEHWASMGSYHLLFLSLIVYWSLFVLYPMAILANDVFGDKKSTKEKWLDVAIVLIGLACFVPFPCFAFWRYGGYKRFLGITKTSNFDARMVGILERLKLLRFTRVFPEVLSQTCENWFNIFFVYYIIRYCFFGPLQWSMSDTEWLLKVGICAQIGAALFWSFRKTTFIENNDPAKQAKQNGHQILLYTTLVIMGLLSNFNHMFRKADQTTLVLSCVLVAIGVTSCFFHERRPAWLRRLVDKEDV